jgi:short-subunit dehydrogenase
MKIAAGQTVLITGASGGIGSVMTHAFAEYGVKLGLVAFPGAELEELRRQVEGRGLKTVALSSDLRDPAERRAVVDRISKELGPVDILVNNAGVEFTAPYHTLTEQNILDVLRVNLEAAMLMTWLVLPGMLDRKHGHILNMSSLAGKANPALQEPYAATKAGLVGFTYSLRASYRKSGVSASVILPGFVETGIYARLKENSGLSAPALLGTSAPEKVVRAVIRAIERDQPEVIINPIPVRPLLALGALLPSVGEWALAQTGGHDFFRKVFEATSKKSK